MRDQDKTDGRISRSEEDMGHKIWSALQSYRLASEQEETPALLQQNATFLASEMKLEDWVRNGGMSQDNFTEFLQPYLQHSNHLHHPGFLGHQVAVPHIGSSIADMVHGVINNPMAVYEMGPTAAVIERVVINWMLEKIGWRSFRKITDFTSYSGQPGGVLTHGGSLANLTAVLAARAAFAPQAWDKGTPGDLALITPQSSHYSMARAASIAGIGSQAIFPALVDELGVLRPERLEQVRAEAVDQGRSVFMVSANACATVTGLYDPIDEIADFCQNYGIWLHIDGAHGASALASDKERHLLKGVHRADSIIWDAHKMLRTSALCAGILFRQQKHLAQIFSQEEDYISFGNTDYGFDMGEFTVECTKAHLGTKLFWVLAMEGEAEIGKFIEKQYSDTKEFYHLINSEPDFECPYLPQSNILCFRYLPLPHNKQVCLRKKILEQGNFYITSASIGDKSYLRLVVMNPLTRKETVYGLLREIRKTAESVN